MPHQWKQEDQAVIWSVLRRYEDDPTHDWLRESGLLVHNVGRRNDAIRLLNEIGNSPPADE
jgi:hypothetical protein